MMGDRVHELEIWVEYFEPILDGSKTFEVRRNDRGFQKGDVLLLVEITSDTLQRTGRSIKRRVGYIFSSSPATDIGSFVVMSLHPVDEPPPPPFAPDWRLAGHVEGDEKEIAKAQRRARDAQLTPPEREPAPETNWITFEAVGKSVNPKNLEH